MASKIPLILDTECYRNYWLAMFLAPNGKTKSFEMYDGHPLDCAGLSNWLHDERFEIVTFNGNTYDIPMITLALSGASNSALHMASTAVITSNIKPWVFYKNYLLDEPKINHVDLIEVAPGQVGLKIYGGRLHSKKMQDLPIEPDATISPEQRELLKLYCRNDLVVTKELFEKLSGAIDLRRTMSKTYGVDLRSKSDAQIAEAVLKSEVARITGTVPKKSNVQYHSFYYEPPPYIRFRYDFMREKLETIKSAKMVVKDTGHVEMPTEIESMDIEIGGAKYKIGIGGLHSQESEVSHYADENTILVDRDVVSYYPNLMLNMGMNPEALGDHFATVYRKILDERVAAKHSGDNVKADSLKITLNGTFGKTSNKYSILYNPEMMIRTTLTGQLSLLMLIELLHYREIPVVSANTDGIVIKCPKDKEGVLSRCIAAWEKATNLKTEETRYKSIHSRDVNNYIAIKEDGKVKTKGVFAPSGLQKNPQNEICTEAVVAYLKDGVALTKTIYGCKDIRKFLTLRTVQGGAHKEGYSLGKAIRWYYSIKEQGVITYKTNGNIVPRSEGARPCMDLPDELPQDIDYLWYIDECEEMLKQLGVVERPFVPKMPRKNSKAWKELVDTGKVAQDRYGDWKWVPA